VSTLAYKCARGAEDQHHPTSNLGAAHAARLQQQCPVCPNLALTFLLSISMLGCGDEVESPTAPSAGPALPAAAALAVPFRQVAAGTGSTTCGLSLDGRAYCWGSGYLGNGALSQSLTH